MQRQSETKAKAKSCKENSHRRDCENAFNAQESSLADDEAATSDAAQPVYSRRLVKRYVFRVVLIILVARVRLSRHISSSRSRSSHAARVADIRANSHHRRSPSSNATALRSFYIFVYAK
ncbi:hypothetical protein U1Q18_050660 [Sarracenia purpurea var. burkii]